MIISIGQHNRKIGAIPSFSLVPVQDCRNCRYCRNDCYALKAVRLYPSTREAWQRNSELARHDPEGLELQLRAWLHARRVTTTFFRIHVAGVCWPKIPIRQAARGYDGLSSACQ